MFSGKKVVVVMPAYNAALTLEATYLEIDFDYVDSLVLVDDQSTDETVRIAKKLGVNHIIKHDKNKGYGANQKTCYMKAIDLEGDIIIMLHPDYQYTPKLIPTMVTLLTSGLYDVVLASRILGNGALKGGMPKYKYVANRILTAFQNLLLNEKLSEYHTGYRAFTKDVLTSINLADNSDDFIFDNEIIAQIFDRQFRVAEVTCPTKYFPEASSISLRRSINYGFGVLRVSLSYWLHQRNIFRWPLLKVRNT